MLNECLLNIIKIICYGILIIILNASTLVFGKSSLDSILTQQEINWLKKNQQEIKFAPNPSWAPADFIDEEGKHKGIVADYVSAVEDRLGIKFKVIKFEDWESVLTGLKNKEANLVGGIQKTKERDSFLIFSEPYIRIPLVIVFRNDFEFSIDSLHKLHISGVKGYASNEYLLKHYPGVEISEYPDDFSSLMQTSFGNADGTIIDILTASYLVEKYGINNLTLGITLDYYWELRFAAHKDFPEIINIVNKALATIGEEEKQEILSNWIKFDIHDSDSFIERNAKTLSIISIIAFVLIILVVLHNHILQKRVLKKTKQLRIEASKKTLALEKAKHSEQQYKILFNHGALPRWIYRLDTLQIIAVNNAACKSYGYNKSDFITKDLKDIWHPNELNLFLNRKPKKTYGNTIYFGIWNHLKSDGSTIKVKVYGSYTKHDNIQCMNISCIDISSEFKAFRALKVSNERYNYVTKATNEAIWEWDLLTGKVFFGHGLTRLFGYSTEESMDVFYWHEKIHIDDKLHIVNNLSKVLNSTENLWSCNFRFRKTNQTYAHVKCKATILRNKRGKAVKLIGALEDITEMIVAIHAIEQQNQKLREIAWIQSHVVRAPVAKILGLINLLNSTTDKKTQEEIFSHINSSAIELDDVIHDILQKTDNIELNEPIDVESLILSSKSKISSAL